MSFLAPLFLLGTVAIALPIIFHLIRRTTREKVPFSSLMFLQPTPPRVTRRSRLENLWLLLLRCLVLALLAFAFARPFVQSHQPARSAAHDPKRVALLVDVSASMQRGDLWARAQAKASDVLENLESVDQAALFVFDGQLQMLMSFDEWTAQSPEQRRSLAMSRLAQQKPGWGRTDLGQALLSACDRMEEAATREKQGARGVQKLVVISDFAQGTRLTGVQGFEWPQGYQVALEPLTSARAANAGVYPVADAANADQTAPDNSLRVRVSNASDSTREQFRLRILATGISTGQTVNVYVPPGESRVARLTLPQGGGRHARVELSGDDHPFDNIGYIAGDQPEARSIMYWGGDPATDASSPLYYLKRAFQKTRRQHVDIAAPALAFTPQPLTNISLLVVATNLPAAQVEVARRFLNDGRVVVLVVRDPAMAPTLAALAGVAGVKVGSGANAAGSYAMLGNIDFEHPLFTAFADPRYSDFTKIHFWKYRRVETADLPGARVVAALDSGDPLLIELPVGRGSLLIFTSGWHPADSQLALSSKFVPLVYSILEKSAGLPAPFFQFTVGDTLPWPDTVASSGGTLLTPDGSTTVLTNRHSLGAVQLPGIYLLASGQTTQSFAINLPPDESNTAPLDLAELMSLGIPMEGKALLGESLPAMQAKRSFLEALELESRQKLWRWIIAGCVAILLLETWVSGRITKGTAAVELGTGAPEVRPESPA